MRVNKLPVEARFADAGLSNHRDDLPAAFTHLVPGFAQVVLFPVALYVYDLALRSFVAH